MLRTDQLTRIAGASGFTGVSLEIPAGETVAIVSEDARSSSMLLRVLATLVVATSGHAWVEGIGVDHAADVRRRLWWAGRVPMLRDTTVGEYLHLIRATRTPAKSVVVADVLRGTCLTAEALITELGERAQRDLELAAAQIADQRILLIDSLCTRDDGASPRWTPVCRDRRARGLTTVVACVHGHPLTRACTSVLTLDRGRMTTPNEAPGAAAWATA